MSRDLGKEIRELLELTETANKINQVNWWNAVDNLELTYRRSVCFDSMIRQVDQRLARVEGLLEKLVKSKSSKEHGSKAARLP